MRGRFVKKTHTYKTIFIYIFIFSRLNNNNFDYYCWLQMSSNVLNIYFVHFKYFPLRFEHKGMCTRKDKKKVLFLNKIFQQLILTDDCFVNTNLRIIKNIL